MIEALAGCPCRHAQALVCRECKLTHIATLTSRSGLLHRPEQPPEEHLPKAGGHDRRRQALRRRRELGEVPVFVGSSSRHPLGMLLDTTRQARYIFSLSIAAAVCCLLRSTDHVCPPQRRAVLYARPQPAAARCLPLPRAACHCRARARARAGAVPPSSSFASRPSPTFC